MSPLKPAIMKSEGMVTVSSQRLTPLIDYGEPEEKRARRKPNFTVQERMHLAKSYVENYEEYNRGFTAATKGEAKIGRQRLLERWASELSSFGVVERTAVEIEQKIRDYMKKIAANRKRAVKRSMSPPCQLISSVIPESSSVEDSTMDDSLTAYAGFLLEQHRASQHDCTENYEPLKLVSNSYETEGVKSTTNSTPLSRFETVNTGSSSRKRKASSTDPPSNENDYSMEPFETIETNEEVSETPELQQQQQQQLDIGRADLALKAVYMDVARKELEKKKLELEAARVNLDIKRLELEEKRYDVERKRLELEQLRKSIHGELPVSSSSRTVGTPPTDQDDHEEDVPMSSSSRTVGTPPTDQDDHEGEL